MDTNKKIILVSSSSTVVIVVILLLLWGFGIFTPAVDCEVSEWGPCDPITGKRKRTVTTKAKNGGAACGVLTESCVSSGTATTPSGSSGAVVSTPAPAPVTSCSGLCPSILKNKCTANMQDDGNFVIYNSTNNPVWKSGTMGKGVGPFKLNMQDDGNLVIYSKDGPTWESGTMGKGIGPYTLKMQDDCNLVIYDSKNTPTWESGTMGK